MIRRGELGKQLQSTSHKPLLERGSSQVGLDAGMNLFTQTDQVLRISIMCVAESVVGHFNLLSKYFFMGRRELVFLFLLWCEVLALESDCPLTVLMCGLVSGVTLNLWVL